jgi:hypothetical protein
LYSLSILPVQKTSDRDCYGLFIPDVSFIDNSEQRTPLILVLDCSGSMQGQPIAQLNQGLKLLEEELKQDVIAAKRVRLLVIKYGGYDECELSGDWCDAMDFIAQLEAMA